MNQTPPPLSGRHAMLECARYHACAAGAVARRALPLARSAEPLAETLDGLKILLDDAKKRGASQEVDRHMAMVKGKKEQFLRLMAALNELRGVQIQHLVWCRLLRLQLGLDIIPGSENGDGDLTTARQVNKLDGTPINFLAAPVVEERTAAPKRESKTY